MNKILTISIAAYNVEKYIEETLKSLIVPSVMNSLEVLIVNDGGTDETVKIAEKFEKEYPDTFKVINKENGGWGSTVNEGLKNASGKYFKLVDGDDKVINIDLLIELLKNTDADLVYTDYNKFYDNTDEIIHVKNKTKVCINKKLDLSGAFFSEDFAMHSCTFRTDILKGKVEITEKCFYTDVEFVLKSMLEVRSVLFADFEVYCYRLGRTGQSASKEGARKHYKEHIKILFGLINIYEKLDKNPTIKEIYKKRLKSMVASQYDFFLNLNPSFEHYKEMKHFDRIIKDNFKEFYDYKRKKIIVFRKFGIVVYPFIVIF